MPSADEPRLARGNRCEGRARTDRSEELGRCLRLSGVPSEVNVARTWDAITGKAPRVVVRAVDSPGWSDPPGARLWPEHLSQRRVLERMLRN